MPQVLYSAVFAAHACQFTLTKNVSYIFVPPPSFLAVKGVGIIFVIKYALRLRQKKCIARQNFTAGRPAKMQPIHPLAFFRDLPREPGTA